MDVTMLLAIVGVLSAWGVVLVAIRRWGPGRAKRWVRCPRRGKRARVSVEQVEGDFGSLRVMDILACSMFADRPLGCDKECLRRL